MNTLIEALEQGRPIDVLCFGNPNIPGDAVAPLIGTLLQSSLICTVLPDVMIVGTIDNPVIRSNYYERMKERRADAFTISVDATLCLTEYSVGTWTYSDGPMIPGSVVTTDIEPVGDATIKCYTATSMEQLLQCNHWVAAVLAHKITTKLMDLLKTTKIKEIYRI